MATKWKQYVDFIKGRGNIENCMIVSSETGALWATTEEKFTLKKYQAKITQEDGEEKEELVNEAANIVNYMKGSSSHQGLRINAGRKHQITRSFKDEVSGLSVVFSKYPQGGACVANGGKCVLIGTFNEDKGHQSPDCNETITLMARYLAMSTWPEVGSVPVGPASWRNYIDTMLVGKGNVEEAMLCTSSGEILAATENFKLKVYQADIAQEDGTDVTETINEKENLLKVVKGTKPSQGLRINEVKYQIVKTQEEDHSGCFAVYGKKSMGGICIMNCGKVIIVATFDEKKNHTSVGCNLVIADLAKHLKNSLA